MDEDLGSTLSTSNSSDNLVNVLHDVFDLFGKMMNGGSH